MNKAIHFKTSMFDVSKERKNPFNPIFGISLLEWLIEELKDVVNITEPDSEDWGWYSELEWKGNKYLIGSAVLNEECSNQTQDLEWVFQVHKYRSFKEKLFGKNKMSESDDCFQFFKQYFENNPKIHSIEVA